MFPVFVNLGPLTVYSYGLLIVVGGALSFAFLYRRRERMGFKKDEHFWLFVNIVLLGGFLGGRTLHIIEYVSFSAPDFWAQVFAFKSGFSVLGAFIAVSSCVYILCRRLGLEFLRVWDYFSVVLPFWHFFGRLGCFAAGCCYGGPSSAPWAVTFTDPRSLVDAQTLGVPVHPTMLYEGVPELGLAVLFYFLLLLPLERGRLRPGYISAAYLGLYSALRFVNEFYRADTVPLQGLGGLTAAQGLSMVFIAASLVLIWVLRRQGHGRGC